MKEISLRIFRQFYSDKCTIGRLDIDDKYFCETLERRVCRKGKKVRGETAIPEGVYKVVLDMSTRFKRILPRILDVEGFTGIRIHSGNTAKNSTGCVLVGFSRGVDCIYRSREAEKALMEILVRADEITLTIL